MAVENVKEEFRKRNEQARSRLKNALSALLAVPEGDAMVEFKINVVIRELNLRNRIAAHLEASDTVVKELDPQLQKELNRLADKLDNAILADASINAALKFAQAILDGAREITAIIAEHSPDTPTK